MGDMTGSLISSAGASVMGQASGIGNMIAAIIAGKQGKKLGKMSTEEWKKETDFDDFTTPQSYLDLLGLSKTMARQEMPGLQAMRGDIAQSTSQALSGAQNLDPGSSAAVLLGAQQNRLSALRQLGIMASQYQSGQQENYRQAIGQGAQYEQQAYEYNQWLPWQMKQNLQQGYQNMGMQMASTGFEQGLGAQIQGANIGSNQMMGWQPQQQQAVAPYTQFQNPAINQLGQQQVQPGRNLGADPYWDAQPGSNPNPFGN